MIAITRIANYLSGDKYVPSIWDGGDLNKKVGQSLVGDSVSRKSATRDSISYYTIPSSCSDVDDVDDVSNENYEHGDQAQNSRSSPSVTTSQMTQTSPDMMLLVKTLLEDREERERVEREKEFWESLKPILQEHESEDKEMWLKRLQRKTTAPAIIPKE